MEKIGYTVWYNNNRYIIKFGQFLEKQYGSKDLKVSQINTEIIVQYIKWRQESLHNKSREGINKTLTPLIQAVQRACENDLLSNKVYAAIKNTYLQSKSRQYTGEEDVYEDVRYMNEEQLNKFISIYPTVRATTQRYMDLFLFSFHTCGLHISDIITLEWWHIDFANRKIKKNLVKFNKPHEVYITDSAMAILNKYRQKNTARFVFGLLPEDLSNHSEFIVCYRKENRARFQSDHASHKVTSRRRSAIQG